MTDEVTTTPEQAQPVDTSQVSDQTEPVTESEQPEEVTTESQPAEVSEPEQTPKPTRAERRLSQLLERNRPAKPRDSFSEYANSLPPVAPSEDGSITQDQLQQIIAQETAKNLSLAREMDTYHASVNEFTSDVESVGQQIETDFGSNKELAETINTMLTEMIEKANVRYDADGRQVLVPSIKPSAIYSQLKQTLKLAQTQGTSQATASMAQQIADGAVTPSTRQPQELDAKTLSPEEIWKNPKAAREALERTLTVARD